MLLFYGTFDQYSIAITELKNIIIIQFSDCDESSAVHIKYF